MTGGVHFLGGRPFAARSRGRRGEDVSVDLIVRALTPARRVHAHGLCAFRRAHLQAPSERDMGLSVAMLWDTFSPR